MNKKLQRKLIKKYPVELGIDTDKPSPYSQRGIECGDGWYSLLDSVLWHIKSRNDNPDWVEEKGAWIKKLYGKCIWNTIVYPMAIRLLPYSGYRWIANHFMFSVKFVRPKNPPVTKVLQVKEKFAGLRIYTNYNDSYIHGVIAMSESLSRSICEDCGTNQNVTINKKGWLRTLCPTCRKKSNR